jgi:hypothetical protein
VLKQGQEGLQDTVRQLESEQKVALLKNATVWNCNSKNCHPAQVRHVSLRAVLNEAFIRADILKLMIQNLHCNRQGSH